jgi:PucR family transcriptional regulator, purine catabolism regulatory protein
MPSTAIGITVSEAMKLGPLGEAIVLGGRAGLDRVITNVTVLETDDAPRLLTGHELLVSAFYALHNDVGAALRWLNELAARGCAGVILCYVGRYFKGDVEALARRADELDLPLLTIPNNEEILYSDIINPILAELLHRQTKRLEYALSVHNRLSQEVLMGADLQTLASSLSDLLHSTVIVADSDLSVIARSPFGAEGQVLLKDLLANGRWRPETQPAVDGAGGSSLLERLRAVVARGRGRDDAWFDVLVQPIQVEHTVAGYLMAFKYGELIDEIHEHALKVGVTVIALERMRAKSVRETERRLQGDFLDDVVHWLVKSPEMIVNRAHALGLDLQDKRVVMVVSIDDPGSAGSEESGPSADAAPCREEVYRLVEGVVRRDSPRNIVVSRGSRLLVLIGVETDVLSSLSIKEQAIALGELILKEFKTSRARSLCRCSQPERQASCSVDLSIGIGNTSRNLSGLHQSYADALQAIEVGRRLFGSGHVMHVDDVSLYSILDFVSERKEARQMVDEVLGPLKAYDAINGTDLLKTLELVCLSGECSSEVARRLYIHRNTLTYRQTRIKEVLGFDPFSGQGRIRLDVALMLDKLIQADQDSQGNRS